MDNVSCAQKNFGSICRELCVEYLKKNTGSSFHRSIYFWKPAVRDSEVATVKTLLQKSREQSDADLLEYVNVLILQIKKSNDQSSQFLGDLIRLRDLEQESINLRKRVHESAGLKTTIVDYYAMLNVSRDATTEIIAQSYRKYIRSRHPDKNFGVSSQGAMMLTEGYNILKNPAERLVYDEQLLKKDPSLVVIYKLSP